MFHKVFVDLSLAAGIYKVDSIHLILVGEFVGCDSPYQIACLFCSLNLLSISQPLKHL